MSTLLGCRYRLRDDILVSPPIWIGSNLLALLTSCRNPVVAPAGRVGVLLSSRQTDLHEAEVVPLPHLRHAWCVDPPLYFDLSPRWDRPRLRRLVLTGVLEEPIWKWMTHTRTSFSRQSKRPNGKWEKKRRRSFNWE